MDWLKIIHIVSLVISALAAVVFVLFLVLKLWAHISYFICRMTEHKWESDQEGGMFARCSRCGTPGVSLK